MTYSYTDSKGDRLEVHPSPDGPRLVAYDTCDGHSTTITIDPAELPEFVAAVYRASSQDAPVMLNPARVAEEWVHVTGTRGAA